MSDLDLFIDITNAIESGRLDSQLSQMYKVLQERSKLIRKVLGFDDFSEGESVMFNDRVATEELRGLSATIVGLDKENDKIIVRLDSLLSGYYKELSNGSTLQRKLRVAPELLDKID
jgi:hypothetical protein